MNPYFSSRMADDRLAERLSDRRSDGRSDGLAERGEGRLGARRAALDVTGVVPVGPAGGPGRRVRRRAGWLLVGAGLRLAMGREAVSLRG